MHVNLAFIRQRFNNEVTSTFSLILTTAYRRVILDFLSVVYYPFRTSSDVTLSRTKPLPYMSRVLGDFISYFKKMLLRT